MEITKKRNYIRFTGVFVIAGIVIATLTAGTSGSPGGKTNSPGDGSNCIQCHGGTLNSGPGTPLIQTNIPAGGYGPGNTYTIDLSISETGINKFGFELTAEDNSNQKMGTFSITNTTETQLVNGGGAVSHTSSGVSGSGSKTWSVDWIAPAVGTGTITFYGILNSSNNNNNASGDNIYTYTLTVKEGLATGLKEMRKQSSFQVFPSPGKDVFHLNYKTGNITKKQISFFSLTGQQVNADKVSIQNHLIIFSLASKPSGTYFINIKNKNGEQLIRKVLKY